MKFGRLIEIFILKDDTQNMAVKVFQTLKVEGYRIMLKLN